MADTKTKVYYFDVRGKGESFRMLLTAAKQPFEDCRISFENWRSDPEIKKATPFGLLPYVIYKGKKYGQSIPLVSYLAKKFGFYGKTDEECLRQEEVMHLVEDLREPHIVDWHFCKDADEKRKKAEEMKTVVFPKFLTFFEKMLAENGDKGFLTGTSVTLADMYLTDMLEICVGIDPQALKDFPLLRRMNENVRSFPTLKDYFVNRPKRPV